MRGISTGTPVPKRDIEMKTRGSGPVITYVLSSEELERYRQGSGTKKEGKSMPLSTVIPKVPDKLEVLRRLAKGKSISKIESELNLGKGVLRYWIGKWGLKGVKGEKAQQMLDELLPEQKTSGEEPGTDETIKQLKKELLEKTAEVNQLQQLVDHLQGDKDFWISEAKKIQEERDALLKTVERAVDSENQSDQPGHDPVNHPAHYTAGKVECIEAIESATIGLSGGVAYCTGAAIKYLWRWSRKGGAEDLQKARWYVDRLIRLIGSEGAG